MNIDKKIVVLLAIIQNQLNSMGADYQINKERLDNIWEFLGEEGYTLVTASTLIEWCDGWSTYRQENLGRVLRNPFNGAPMEPLSEGTLRKRYEECYGTIEELCEEFSTKKQLPKGLQKSIPLLGTYLDEYREIFEEEWLPDEVYWREADLW